MRFTEMGCKEEMDFSGESIVVDANGNVIAKAEKRDEQETK